MHHVLVILLHRPFVADGHLYSTSRSISVDSFMKCASAASSIVQLLRPYHRAFSIRRAPYLISYATYVAATIHTRIAARRAHDSTAYNNLATCLVVFKENQETNSAVKKASLIVQGLMKRLGVVIENLSIDVLETEEDDKPKETAARDDEAARRRPKSDDQEQRAGGRAGTTPRRKGDPVVAATYKGTGFSPGADWMDIDGIIQSFLQEHDGNHGNRSAAPEQDSGQDQLPRTPWLHHGNHPQVPMGAEYSMATHSAMGMAPRVVQQPESAFGAGGYGWPGGWRSTTGDLESLENPLFGFNGSSLDSFAFMGW